MIRVAACAPDSFGPSPHLVPLQLPLIQQCGGPDTFRRCHREVHAYQVADDHEAGLGGANGGSVLVSGDGGHGAVLAPLLLLAPQAAVASGQA